MFKSFKTFISPPLTLNDKNPTSGKPSEGVEFSPNCVVILPIDVFFCLINVGASFEISSILYLTVPPEVLKTLELVVCFFFSIKNVSLSTLFLSADEKLSQTLPSSAS